jgi:hypothetical protein
VTLRELLTQRSARLQEQPALTAPSWGELRYPAFRNRVEGLARGLVLEGRDRFHCRTGGPWDWACEVACACCGFQWDPDAAPPDPELLGGARFNHEDGRQAYHDREHQVLEGTPFAGGLDQGELVRRLRRLNGRLGWDHASVVPLPLEQLASPELRAALWSVLYAGGHAILRPGPVPGWDSALFQGFWT